MSWSLHDLEWSFHDVESEDFKGWSWCFAGFGLALVAAVFWLSLGTVVLSPNDEIYHFGIAQKVNTAHTFKSTSSPLDSGIKILL